MNDKMKVGIVGARHFAAARRRWMQETDLFDIRGCYNRTPGPAQELEKAEGIKAFATYEELLALPDIEGMVICSGASAHAEQTLKALDRGLHVFVEKPLCSTADEMRALLKAQRKSGRVVGMGHADHRNTATSLTVKRLLDEGKLGKVACFEKTTAHAGGQQLSADNWRADPAKNPGGMLFQCGVHSIHEMLFYFESQIKEVFAMMRNDVHTTRTADVAMCQLRFENGLIGGLNAYHVTPYRHTLSIFGTKANLYRDDRYFDEGTTICLQEEHLDGRKEPRVPVEISGEQDPCGSLKSFYNAVRNGTKAYPSIVDGSRAVAVVFAAEKSAKSGRPEAVEDIPD